MVLLAARGLSQESAASQSVPASAGGAASSAAAIADHAKADAEAPPDKRVLGVLPNYRTINETGTYTPITSRQKMIIALKDSFDYPLVGLAAAYAGLSQLEDSDESFGQGMKGYGQRLWTNYVDQAVGNMFSEGIMPSLLHEDPRYRRIGPTRGSKKYRAGYALSRVMVTRTDSGGTRFNFSEWTGNAIGTALSNTYHPDGRDVTDNVTKLLTAVATDAVSQVLKEFWPDIKHKLFHRKPAAAAAD